MSRSLVEAVDSADDATLHMADSGGFLLSRNTSKGKLDQQAQAKTSNRSKLHLSGGESLIPRDVSLYRRQTQAAPPQ